MDHFEVPTLWPLVSGSYKTLPCPFSFLPSLLPCLSLSPPFPFSCPPSLFPSLPPSLSSFLSSSPSLPPSLPPSPPPSLPPSLSPEYPVYQLAEYAFQTSSPQTLPLGGEWSSGQWRYGHPDLPAFSPPSSLPPPPPLPPPHLPPLPLPPYLLPLPSPPPHLLLLPSLLLTSSPSPSLSLCRFS